jgi:hypothetical protein
MPDERRVIPERRTQALRGPGAGGFTPAQSVSASNPCLNCGTNIQLEFCPECGQREIDSDPTLRDYFRELGEVFVRREGKVVATYRALVLEPGFLTTEYLAGRRVRYVSPPRLFLSCAVAFFLLAALLPIHLVLGRFGHAMLRAGPIALFVLMPLFAAAMRLVYRDRHRRYPQHLAFAMHVMAVLSLALCVMLPARLFTSATGAGIYALVVAIPFAIYAVRATAVVYESSRAQAISRLFTAFAMYAVAVLAVVFLSS